MRPLSKSSCLQLPLLLKPFLAILQVLKQSYGLFTIRLCAEELLRDVLAAAGFAEISSPEEKAHLGGHEAHTALGVVITQVFPPLPLSGAEGSHVKDQTGHGFKCRRGSRPVDLLTIQPKGPVSGACNNA